MTSAPRSFGRRLLRRFAVTLVVLGLVFVGGNIALERVAESKVASLAAKQLHMSALPRIDLGGFPIGLGLVRGRLARVSVEASGVKVGDIVVRRVSVRLEDLNVPGGWFGPRPYTLVIGRGSVVVVMDEDGINGLLRQKQPGTTVRLRASGVRVRARRAFAGRTRTIVATGRIRLRSGRLTFVPRSVTVDGQRPPPGFDARARREATFSVDVPEMPSGITLDTPEVGEGTVTVSAALKGNRIKFG